jgi:hypothetical protein
MREHGCRWALTPSVVRECGTLYGEAIADAISWTANVQRSLWNSGAGSTTLRMVGVDKPSPAGRPHPPASLAANKHEDGLLPST